MSRLRDLVERLGLQRHPEGGWYRETHRSSLVLPSMALPEGYPSDRVAVTSILYLLPAGERSRRHRVRSEELWFHHGGDALRLWIEAPDGRSRRKVDLGAAPGREPQAVVPAGWWQAAETLQNEEGYALLGCVVAPGFEFEDFEIAADPDT